MARASRTPARKLLLPLLAVLLIGGGLALGADRRAAASVRGERLEGEVLAPAGETLRVATFNIHSGRTAEGEPSLTEVARTLEGLDVVGLQEVRAPFASADQAEELGSALGLGWLFGPSERRFFRDHFGNGLLSRLAATEWWTTPLPNSRGKGYRSRTTARVDWGGETLTVIVAHVDRVEDRVRQLELVLEALADAPPPVVLLADLNTRPGDPELERLLAPLADVVDASPPGEERVDWILVRGLEVLDRGRLDRGASDHACLWAELAPAQRGQ